MLKDLNLESLKNKISVFKQSLNRENTDTSISISGLTANSKKVKPGDLFIAEKGVSSDGHQFIPQAMANGAVGLLVEKPELVPQSFQGFVLVTQNTRSVTPHLASLFYDHPSEKIFCVGITGTNGKTSLTYLVEHLLNSIHKPTGVIGTVNHHLGTQVWSTEMTTPHPIELQERVSDFISHGAKALAIEVSSHALDQARINGLEFDVGVFTNLTRDHLDYHLTMEEYFKTKERFFTEVIAQSNKSNLIAIINRDDPWGEKIKTPSPLTRWNYGQSSADLTFQLLNMDFSGTQIKIQTPMGNTQLQSPLIGTYNIYNVLAAAGAALASGMTLHQIEKHLPHFSGVPGRLQKVPNNQNLSVFIDYAHSPDALENVLLALNSLRQKNRGSGKIICVFGCGGDRDKGKRPQMAKVAETLADIVVLTSDNPRTEDPMRILDEVQKGFTHSRPVKIIIEANRETAISMALNETKIDDVVLIAGKGHEDYQIIGKEKFYFSDFDVVRKLLS